jgi:hypothetical protein
MYGAIDEFPNHVYERLAPLPPYLYYVIVNDERFSRVSSTYNNILSFAATGVSNDSSGGFVNSAQGDSCVTINGRTYHFFPTASNVNPSGGLSYFIFDLPEAVKRHADLCNSSHNGRFHNIDEDNLISLYEEMQTFNPLAHELRIAGMELNNNAHAVVPILDQQILVSEVASLTADSTNVERTLRVKLANETSRDINFRSKFAEPLCYPLLFNEFEIGWGEQVNFYENQIQLHKNIILNSADITSLHFHFTII